MRKFPEYIVFPDHGAERAVIGGKAVGLTKLAALGAVPPWFVLPAATFGQDLAADCGDAHVPALPPEMAASLVEAARALAGPDGYLAVRSSCVDEDGEHYSFAGQFLSLLNVKPEDVPEAALSVWRSGFAPGVAAYRRTHGLGPACAPAILVQLMVDADRAGVAFGADPVTGRPERFAVSAVKGLGADLVSGKVRGDTWLTDLEGTPVETSLTGRVPCLSGAELREIARILKAAEQLFGCPQDMEWAIHRGTLYLLQSRPITSLSGSPQEADCILWDNSNLVESYSGITTPLTFSFARDLYERVYRQMAAVLGVEASRIERNADAFRNMVGMIRGRMYYNLLNWYRCLSLLPGFSLNRRLMEQMMGVDRALPEHLLTRLRPERAETAAGRLADGFRILKMLAMIFGHRLRLRRAVHRFHGRIDLLLGRSRRDISGASLGELAASYRFLERELINKWSVPLVNDLFCMLSFGLLKRALAGWAGDRDGSVCNGLLVDRGGVISAVPARCIVEMSRLVAEQPLVRELIGAGRTQEALVRIRELPDLSRRFESYLDKFGDRCLGELKLESSCLREDAAPLLHAIAAAGGGAVSGASRTEGAREAERTLKARLRGRPLRRLTVRVLLAEARARIRDRENMRFERTRVFGHARRLFLEVGRRLEAAGRLEHSRDVFYLTAEEIFGFLDGTLPCPDLVELAAVRMRNFEKYRGQPPLPRRFETSGAAGMERIRPVNSPDDETVPDTGADDQKRGLGCAPGWIQGAVRVVTDPQSTLLSAGEILVAEFTDPGWVTLMAQAGGMIVERGSLLSHSAIVARELGIPTVVAVEGATSWLCDGDIVRLDGGTGVIRRCAPGGKAGEAA